MKKTGILNPNICRVIASLGHTDYLVICDAGFPCPPNVERIDLTLLPGIPAFLDVLKAVTDEMAVEKIILAQETSQVSPDLYRQIREMLPGIPEMRPPHVEFKQHAARARAVIRTAEFTSYANIILQAGVVY